MVDMPKMSKMYKMSKMSKMSKKVIFEDLEADVVDLAVLLRISIVASHDKAIAGETGLLEASDYPLWSRLYSDWAVITSR